VRVGAEREKSVKKLSRVLVLGTACLSLTTSANASVVGNINPAVEKLLGHEPRVVNIFDAQKQNLDRATTRYQPWSGSYWPDISGGVANHWRDHDGIWAKVRFLLRYDVAKATLQNDFKQVVERYQTWDNGKLSEKLSPSEKYDLLMGDSNFTLTKAILAETDFRANYRLTTKTRDGNEVDTDASEGDDNNAGSNDVQGDDSQANSSPLRPSIDQIINGHEVAYQKYDSKVEFMYWRKKGGTLAYWSGICDGWAPASVYLPRPTKPVTVTNANGTPITFFPDDIKALGTYLFARTNTPYFSTMNYRFAGRKCSESGKPETTENGYVKDIRCNDLDAGVWHLSLLNRIGKDRTGFVMDVDNNLKINNHPVSSYELTYFNPATGKAGSLKESVVDRNQVKDGYLSRRNPKSKYLVGVTSKVHMLFYIWPEAKRADGKERNQDYDNAAQDVFKDVSYDYDLELDANGNILGGEWGKRSDDKKNAVKYADQPDFIWMGNSDALPYSEMSIYATAGTVKDASNPRPFGNMDWTWDGKSPMPADWTRAAQADLTWAPPVTGEKVKDKATKTESVQPEEAKNAVLKSAQPLSHVVYYLFDQARGLDQK
jgi:hypothetical protein